MKCRFCNNYFGRNFNSFTSLFACTNCNFILHMNKSCYEVFFSSDHVVKEYLNHAKPERQIIMNTGRLHIEYYKDNSLSIEYDWYDSDGKDFSKVILHKTKFNDVIPPFNDITPQIAQKIMKKYEKTMILS